MRPLPVRPQSHAPRPRLCSHLTSSTTPACASCSTWSGSAGGGATVSGSTAARRTPPAAYQASHACRPSQPRGSLGAEPCRRASSSCQSPAWACAGSHGRTGTSAASTTVAMPDPREYPETCSGWTALASPGIRPACLATGWGAAAVGGGQPAAREPPGDSPRSCSRSHAPALESPGTGARRTSAAVAAGCHGATWL